MGRSVSAGDRGADQIADEAWRPDALTIVRQGANNHRIPEPPRGISGVANGEEPVGTGAARGLVCLRDKGEDLDPPTVGGYPGSGQAFVNVADRGRRSEASGP